MIETSRRSFIGGLTALIVAPAIVRADSLMPIKGIDEIVFQVQTGPNGFYRWVAPPGGELVCRTTGNRIDEILGSGFIQIRRTSTGKILLPKGIAVFGYDKNGNDFGTKI
jgi:hypothetical protein